MIFPRRCCKQLVSQQKGRWGYVKEGLFQRRTGAGGAGFADGGAANAVPAGPKGTTLQDILQAVGISKPFFYGNYYSSLAQLVLHIINYENMLLLREVQESVRNQDMSLEEMIHHFLDMVTHSRQYHFFVMTQEEEMWVYKHLSPEEFETYQQGQEQFYEQVLALWHIPQEKCRPKELGNLILSVVLTYNSAARSLPFFFPVELERTAQAQATALSRYLDSLVDTGK